MRFTRLNKLILGVGVGAALSCAMVSCAGTDESGASDQVPEQQTGTDGSSSPDLDASDASDASSGDKDAARIYPSFDAAPPSIECESDSCVMSLTMREKFSYSALKLDSPPDRQDYVSGTAGSSFCALLRDGTVACWGANDGAQLGRGVDAGSAWGSPTPTRVPGLSNIVQLAGTCAVDKDGVAWGWSYGPYRNMDTSPVPTIEASPMKLALDPVKKVTVGSFWTWLTGCAILEDDGVVCWGTNMNGVVSSTDITRNAILPVQPVPLPAGRRARDIGVGTAAVVLMDDGSLVSWGDNPTLGRATSMSPNPYPGQIAITGMANAFDVRRNEACATAWGAGYCWGAGTDTLVQNPITFFNLDNLERALPSPIASPEPIRQISASGTRGQGCAVGESGAVYCWGDNSYGQVGDGTKEFAAKPAKVAGLPVAAVEVRAAGDSTCALLVNGKVYCWGADQYGQLGNGSLYEPSLVPQEVTLP